MHRLGVEMYMIFRNNSSVIGDTSGSFWRFMVLLDSKVTRYIIRDCDAKLSVRDAEAV